MTRSKTLNAKNWKNFITYRNKQIKKYLTSDEYIFLEKMERKVSKATQASHRFSVSLMALASQLEFLEARKKSLEKEMVPEKTVEACLDWLAKK